MSRSESGYITKTSKMDDGGGRRVRCKANIGDILLIGEQLRIQMHSDSSNLIRDRRHHFRMCQCCMIGSDVVDWLLQTNQAPDRETATLLLNILVDNSILHHVYDVQPFKDEYIFYRFRKDDGTFPWCEDLNIFMKGQRIYNKIYSDGEACIVRTQQEEDVSYHEAFQGCDFVDWLVSKQEATSRDEGVKEGRIFLENGIVRHAASHHHFKDEPLLYQFKRDFGRQRTLVDLVLPQPEDDFFNTRSSTWTEKSAEVKGYDKYMQVPKMRPNRTESGYHSDQIEGTSPSSHDDSPVISSSDDGLDDSGTRNKQLKCNRGSGVLVLIRQATVEELEDPRSPYIKKQLRIDSDPVGFGFVIRGEGPVYVKTVDPTGPAATAGMKVGQFIYSVNHQKVLDLNYRDLGHLILASIGCVNLSVLEHT